MSIFEMAKIPLKKAEKVINIHPDAAKILAQPERTLEVSIPVRMDDGRLEVFTGYRSQNSTVLGPAKGGIRFHPNVTMDEVKTLSFWMTCKCAVLNLPYGGGKGGIVVDPTKLSKGELERLARGFIQKISLIIGDNLDIPAPDVNTNATIMGWMVDEFSKIKGYNVPGVITGKPLVLGGSKGRTSATGRGVMFATREAFKRLGIEAKEATVAVQGFGNVGGWSAKLMHDLGSKIVAVSDVYGAIANPAGLNPYEVEAYAQKTGSVVGYPGAQAISNNELLEMEVTVLIPAALEGQITMDNAERIKAKIVSEGANGPTNPDADEILEKNGIVVIPDILANAGGVTVSYFEWVQNLYRYYWTEEEVQAREEAMMVDAFNQVYEASKKYKVNMRVGAYVVALERLTEAMKWRGMY